MTHCQAHTHGQDGSLPCRGYANRRLVNCLTMRSIAMCQWHAKSTLPELRKLEVGWAAFTKLEGRLGIKTSKAFNMPSEEFGKLPARWRDCAPRADSHRYPNWEWIRNSWMDAPSATYFPGDKNMHRARLAILRATPVTRLP